MRRTYPPPELCPQPQYHGNPWRYCPACTWTELDDEQSDDVKPSAHNDPK